MKMEPFDLTRELTEPNGSPMPLNDQPRTTLGGLVYFALTRTQAADSARRVCISVLSRVASGPSSGSSS